MAENPASRRARLVQEMIARERWSRERLLEHQRLALRELIRHAASASPYYRELLGPDAAASEIPLEELPTLPKTTLMSEWDRVVTDPRLRLAGIEQHFASDDPGALYLDEYRVLATGGATGTRGVFIFGADEFEIVIAGCMRALAVIGVAPDTHLAAIGSPSPLHLTSHVFAALRAGRASTPRFTVTTPLEHLVAQLNDNPPEAIATHATILRQLADEELEGRLRIEPRIAATSSERLTDETRERAHQAWGIPVYNVYACTDAGLLASECPAQAGLHVWEDCTILEVVDERNRPVPPGVPGDKVLLTNLWSRTQPLIRYELEDSVTLAGLPNPTGRPFARIASVDGRSADILQLAAPGGGEIPVHPYHLGPPFARFPEVRQYQIRHSDDGLHVRLVLAPDAPRNLVEQLRASLVEALAGAGAVPPPIHVQPVEAITRVGSAAKLTLVETDVSHPMPDPGASALRRHARRPREFAWPTSPSG